MKSVMAGALTIGLGLVAYVLLSLDEYVATGLGLSTLTINAFLFLMGLSSALSLLSPPLRSRRFGTQQPNWRDVHRETPNIVNATIRRRRAG